jgi:hypothetical protein
MPLLRGICTVPIIAKVGGPLCGNPWGMGMACGIFAGWHFVPDIQESSFVLSMEIQSTLGDVPGTCHSRVAPERGGMQ